MSDPVARRRWMTASNLFVLLALVCFVLAAFHAAVPVADLVPLGLTFLAAGMLDI